MEQIITFRVNHKSPGLKYQSIYFVDPVAVVLYETV